MRKWWQGEPPWRRLRRLLLGPPANPAEQITDDFILAAKKVGAKSPREAAEIAQGRRLTDEEWGKCAEVWQRRWYSDP